MAKKPAPLTSDLLVRKGEASPSSIDPTDRASEIEATSETPDATDTHPAQASATDDGRPQTPEPEIVLAADEKGDGVYGSRRRLAAVLAFVAIVTAAVFAVNMYSSDGTAPSVAPVTDNQAPATSEEPTVAPIIAAPGPESIGSPTAPGESELRLSPSDDVAAPSATDPASEPAETVAAPAPVEETVVAQTTPPKPARETATITPQTSATDSEAREATAPETATSTPVAPVAEPAAGKIAAPGQYLVQLLSVRSETAARTAWTRLQRLHSGLLGGEQLNLETADLGERGTYYRVRFGAFDNRSAANAVCQSLKEAGQDCLVKRVN